MKIGCEFPYSHWFIDSLYEKYNSTNQTIDLKSFKVLMHDLGLNEVKSVNSSLRVKQFLIGMRSNPKSAKSNMHTNYASNSFNKVNSVSTFNQVTNRFACIRFTYSFLFI